MNRFSATRSDGALVEYPAAAPVQELDVRDDLRAGHNPLIKVLTAVGDLEPGAVLHLRTTFAPIALVEILEAQGFVHHLTSAGDDEWSVWFWRPGAGAPSLVPAGPARAPAGSVYSILTRRFRNHG